MPWVDRHPVWPVWAPPRRKVRSRVVSREGVLAPGSGRGEAMSFTTGWKGRPPRVLGLSPFGVMPPGGQREGGVLPGGEKE